MKEEEKHIFVFNLQQSIKLKIAFDYFKETEITLDCSDSRDRELKQTMIDQSGRSLNLYIMTSTKVAGKKVTFYVKNCVIDYT